MTKLSPSATSIHSIGGWRYFKKVRKINIRPKDRKEEVKSYRLADNLIVYVENPRAFTK